MIICLTLLCGYAKAQTRGGDSSPPLPKEISAELFDKAVALIKEFEGWHSAKHYPYIGYGHKLLPHENLTADITEAQADSLLRADLLERYKYFRRYGKDALLLTVLAYNVGHSRLLGYGKRPKSNLIKKIESGDRDITKSISRTVATRASLSPASNAAEKESFNCCIYLKRKWRLLG